MAMADEMQGIMSLPDQPPMEQTAAPTAEQSAAVEQMRSQLSPSEINTEMLGAAEQADPATVAEFKAELQGLELPPEVLDMLNTMVEEILDAPQDYEAIRAKYLAQGLEDLLPPEFDATFFGALNMAIDQIRGAAPAGQPATASGVNTVEDIFSYKPAAAAPMAPQGFAQGGIASLGRNGDTMLAHINPQEAALLRSRGGSGSINPRTGLPEFFSLKGAFKKIGRAVKKFAGTTVGKIVIGAALFAVAGPAAVTMFGGAGTAAVAAAQGFAASAGTTMIAGGNLKDSLKAGAVGALTAGALKGVTQGRSAFQPIPKAVGAGAPIVDSIGTNTGAGAAPPVGATTSPAISTGEGVMRSPLAAATPSAQASGTFNFDSLGGSKTSPMGFSSSTQPTLTPGIGTAGTAGTSPGFFGNMKAALTKDTMGVGGADTGFLEGLNKAFNPAQIEAAAKAAGNPAPGAFTKYAPLVGAGLGIMAATGGLEGENAEVPAGFEDMAAGISPGEKLLKENPDKYGLKFGGVRTSTAYDPYAFMQAQIQPIARRQGGIAELTGYRAGGDHSQFPRKNGHINGPGTGTSDDVPAMLSDGEFVFTAKAVRALGDGSRRKGAKRMLALMKKLEGRSNG